MNLQPVFRPLDSDKLAGRGAQKFAELKATGNLPSPQGVALKVIELANREDVTAAELARTLKADPALSGRLLKAANSAARGERAVATINDAVVRLGFRSVRQLALTFSLIEHHQSGACTAFDYGYFWSHALATAVAAQRLALNVNAGPGEECFTLGLLHNVGALALATLYPTDYAAVLTANPCASDAARRIRERSVFGVCHRELTALMLQDWGLPPLFGEAIMRRDETDAAAPASHLETTSRALACAVHLGHLCATEQTPDAAIEDLRRLYARAGGAEGLEALLEDAASEWREWGKLLQVPTRDVPSLADLDQRALSSGQTPMPRLRVLIAEDTASQRLVLIKQVEALGFEAVTAQDGEHALVMIEQQRPHILLTDWVMPKIDGIGVCKVTRASDAGKLIYIIMLTSHGDEDHLVEAFAAGADDYVTKPIKPRELEARLRAGKRVVELQVALRREAENLQTVNRNLAVANRQLFDFAHTDALTGLPNRRYILDRLKQEWSVHTRRLSPLSLILLDIDYFKVVNDKRGHDVGDTVLERVAHIMRREIRTEDTVARFGGEEFLIITPGVDLAGAKQVAERIRVNIAREVFTLSGTSWHVTASLGVATANLEAEGFQGLLKSADQALYCAKGAGRNQVRP